MALSIFLAQLVGLSMLLAGLGLLLGGSSTTKALNKMVKDEGVLMTTGLIMIVAGSALVITHNIWEASWTLLITIVGWAMVLKGFFMLAFPKLLNDLYDYFMKIKGIMMVGAGFWVIGGLFLLYYGFYA